MYVVDPQKDSTDEMSQCRFGIQGAKRVLDLAVDSPVFKIWPLGFGLSKDAVGFRSLQ